MKIDCIMTIFHCQYRLTSFGVSVRWRSARRMARVLANATILGALLVRMPADGWPILPGVVIAVGIVVACLLAVSQRRRSRGGAAPSIRRHTRKTKVERIGANRETIMAGG